MATANEELFDDIIRHQVGLRRFTEAQLRALRKLLRAADEDLLDQIQNHLRRLDRTRGGVTLERLEELLTDVRQSRTEAMRELYRHFSEEMRGLAVAEGALEVATLNQAIPIVFDTARVPNATLRALITNSPVRGRQMRKWFTALKDNDRNRIEDALRLSIIEGETLDAAVRRLRGTRAGGFADGILSTSTREAETIARTAITHFSNAARNEVWQANSDILEGLRWTATLDGRTSRICSSLDGKVFPLDGGRRPPAHPNCRSVMVPVLDGVGILGKRPSVTDTRTRARREIDFRVEAKKRGIKIQQVRQEWAAQHVGRLPAETTYAQFLKRQSKDFQVDVLGVQKAELFRKGKLPLDKFVDASGRELTLKELMKRQPAAWRRAFGE